MLLDTAVYMEKTPQKATVFSVADGTHFKEKAFAWAANAFDVFCYLDNNAYTEGGVPPRFEGLLACGIKAELTLSAAAPQPFERLQAFHQMYQDWCFGFLSYDLKNKVENLASEGIDGVGMPDLHFFVPQVLIEIGENQVSILAYEALFETAADCFEAISVHNGAVGDVPDTSHVAFSSRFSKAEYLETVAKIQHHIAIGDIFELNFCQEFFTENADINPFALFLKLNQIAKAPFSAFYRWKDRFVLCASPERFLWKNGDTLVSQPIKGTSKRGETPQEDAVLKDALRHDAKNRAENIMIVDLVRNDLGRVAAIGTVRVPVLCGIYTFPTVHQMISTVEAQQRTDVGLADVLKATFPMGSMTGAPKVRAMQLTEQYERSKRGVYSGAIGYIKPNGDFDFNVVIRSLLYNKNTHYLSFQVGGAIIFDSDPEKEYEECLVKARTVLRALGKSTFA